MVDTSPGANGAVLDLGMRPQLYPGREHGIRTDPAVSPNAHVVAELAALETGLADHHSLTGSNVVENRHRPDLASRTELGGPGERGHGVNDTVHANLDARVHEGGGRVLNGHAREHEGIQGPAPKRGFGGRQLAPIVDEDELVGIGCHERLHRSGEELDDVGEVVLALRVGAGQAVERRPELGAVEDIDAPVAFHRHRFARGEVPLLDDAQDVAGVVAHGSAQPGRIGGDAEQHGAGARRGGVCREEPGQGLGRDQWGVADHDQDRAVTS